MGTRVLAALVLLVAVYQAAVLLAAVLLAAFVLLVAVLQVAQQTRTRTYRIFCSSEPEINAHNWDILFEYRRGHKRLLSEWLHRKYMTVWFPCLVALFKFTYCKVLLILKYDGIAKILDFIYIAWTGLVGYP